MGNRYPCTLVVRILLLKNIYSSGAKIKIHPEECQAPSPKRGQQREERI